MFRGLEGFGDSAEIHRHRIAHRGQSIAVTIVDTADTHRLIPEVEAMMDTGMIATSDVDCIRIEKPGGA